MTERIERLVALGTTDEHTECGCCGRVNLKETLVMAVRDVDGNVGEAVAYYGVVCGARAAGRPVGEIRREAKDGDDAVREAEAAAKRLAAAADFVRCEQWWTAEYGTADRDEILKRTGKLPFEVYREARAALGV